jgi:dienelactone hydrolase
MRISRIVNVRRRHRSIVALAVLAIATVAATLSGCEMPAEGRYVSEQYTADEITPHYGRVYGTAVDYRGVEVDLKLDVYLPPDEGLGPLPTVVLVHGGGFERGNRFNMAEDAKGYAQKGFVAVSIGYRLDPEQGNDPVRRRQAVQNAVDDGMESIRWLRANAATYRIDTTRIAMVGVSAGGFIAQSVGAADDLTPDGPLSEYPKSVSAVVSTGANLASAIESGAVTLEATDAPTLLFHYDVDTVTGSTYADAEDQCEAMVAAGAVCELVRNDGEGHTVSVSSTAENWTPHIGPFLWTQLALYLAPGL